MTENYIQAAIVALVIVGAVLLKALGQISDDLIAAILTGALGWTGGHAVGFTQGKNK